MSAENRKEVRAMLKRTKGKCMEGRYFERKRGLVGGQKQTADQYSMMGTTPVTSSKINLGHQ